MNALLPKGWNSVEEILEEFNLSYMDNSDILGIKLTTNLPNRSAIICNCCGAGQGNLENDGIRFQVVPSGSVVPILMTPYKQNLIIRDQDGDVQLFWRDQ